jgi:hypothetical protein
MTINNSAGEAILNSPNTVTVKCKVCGIVLTGSFNIIDHLDAHESGE